MLWYTEQSVPDPSCTVAATACPNINALMPQVYLPQNYTGATAGGTISGNNVNLTFADSITNTGIIQATDLNVTTDSLTNEQRSVDIGKQAYQVQGGWMEYTGTQLQPGGFMSAVNLDVQAQNITAVNNAFQVLNADGTPDAAGTAALLSSLKQQLSSDFTQTNVQDNIQNNFIQDTSGPGALGAVIAIVIAIVLAVVTAGAGLAIVGAMTGSVVAAGSAAAAVAAGLQAAIVGTLSSMATQLVTTGSLDIGQALKSGAVSGLTEGLTDGILGDAPGTPDPSSGVAPPADSAGAVVQPPTGFPPVSQASLASLLSNPQYVENTLIRAGISAGINSAAYGGSFGTALANNLISDAAATGANAIGDWTIPSDGSAPNELENILGHAVLGCAASAAEGTGCAGGAIGAATSAVLTPFVANEVLDGDGQVSPAQAAIIKAVAALMGGVAANAAGANAQAGATSAENEAQNNCLGHTEGCLEIAKNALSGFWNGAVSLGEAVANIPNGGPLATPGDPGYVSLDGLRLPYTQGDDVGPTTAFFTAILGTDGIGGEVTAEGEAGVQASAAANTLAANKLAGSLAEEEVAGGITSQGFQVQGQVSLKSGSTRAVADFAVNGAPNAAVQVPAGYVAEVNGNALLDANGSPATSFNLNSQGQAIVEVKTGNGTLTSNQADVYPAVQSGTAAGTQAGTNAAKAGMSGPLPQTPVIVLRKL